MDNAIRIYWTSPFPISGMSGVFVSFHIWTKIRYTNQCSPGLPMLYLPGRLAQSGASLIENQGFAGSIPVPATILSLRFGHEKRSTTILTLPLIHEGHLSVAGGRMGTKY